MFFYIHAALGICISLVDVSVEYCLFLGRHQVTAVFYSILECETSSEMTRLQYILQCDNQCLLLTYNLEIEVCI